MHIDPQLMCAEYYNNVTDSHIYENGYLDGLKQLNDPELNKLLTNRPAFLYGSYQITHMKGAVIDQVSISMYNKKRPIWSLSGYYDSDLEFDPEKNNFFVTQLKDNSRIILL